MVKDNLKNGDRNVVGLSEHKTKPKYTAKIYN